MDIPQQTLTGVPQSWANIKTALVERRDMLGLLSDTGSITGRSRADLFSHSPRCAINQCKHRSQDDHHIDQHIPHLENQPDLFTDID